MAAELVNFKRIHNCDQENPTRNTPPAAEPVKAVKAVKAAKQPSRPKLPDAAPEIFPPNCFTFRGLWGACCESGRRSRTCDSCGARLRHLEKSPNMIDSGTAETRKAEAPAIVLCEPREVRPAQLLEPHH